MLTNKSKNEGKRFYIGSKVECTVVDLNGIKTIFDKKTGKPYYSSSKSPTFHEDLKRGDIFEAEILEKVDNRRNLYIAESKWINSKNAVLSEDFYNMSDAFEHTYCKDAMANRYGETIAEYASRNSQASKRDGTAKSLGFSNFGELAFAIHRKYKECGCWKTISEEYGKHRHWALSIVKPFNMDKAEEDVKKNLTKEVREFIANKASLKYAAESLGIELPAARVLLGDFNSKMDRAFSVAVAKGLSKKELEFNIARAIIHENKNTDIVAREFCIDPTSLWRYFMRFVKGNIRFVGEHIELTGYTH